MDLVSLKNDLKVWEKLFAAQNGGKKPSRDDIKANIDIAAKYKLYNDLRQPAKTQTAPKEQRTPSKPRTTTHVLHATPQRQTKYSVAPPHPFDGDAVEGYLLDVGQEYFSPAKENMCIIGPTPHKDGRVLGLFDCMPSATPREQARAALGEVSRNVIQTPSKRSMESSNSIDASPGKPSRTPQSAGKRFMLDAFVTTPSKRLRLDPLTPSSSRHLQTPPLFRRHTVATETIPEEPSPQKVQPFKRRSFGRSLSSMIRDMKQQQEKEMDAELEMLHEMEAENNVPPPPVRRTERVAETQFEEFDEDAMAALEEAEQEGQKADQESNQEADRAGGSEAGKEHEQPARKAWKKKGQKRQTKRIIMRPVRVKPLSDTLQSAPGAALDIASDENDESDSAGDDESGSDFEAAVDGSAVPTTAPKKAKPAAKPQDEKPKGRTINPNAMSHANFRSLKIKNKNSKAKGRGRFGRGR